MHSKADFVRNELTALVRCIDPNIEALGYFIDNNSGEEFVTILSETQLRHVCVTADSLSALTLDVLGRIV